jgi:competence/damage-inducible protein CinA-like protein
MQAEVISIGDELTSGQRLDTNSQWLSSRLAEIGVRTLYHTTVADELDANVRVFKTAVDRADIVIATGGLGPTADDLTRDAVAAAAAVPLELDAAALKHIEGLFKRRSRPMPERNRVQAYFPRGSRVVPNPAGTAPGIDLDIPRPNRRACRLFALPGVPAEMQEMWEQTVAPAIQSMTGAARVICHRRIKCFGVGESDLEAMLPDLTRRGREPTVGITVHGATITLRITASGETREACLAAMEPTVQTIRQCLGDLVFGEEDDELQHGVLRLLRERGKTVATAEWGSGGMIAHWLSEVPESRDAFAGGLVLPTRQAVFDLVQPAGRSPLSERAPDDAGMKKLLVERMADECRQLYRADYGLAVGELPRVNPQASEPGKLWFAVSSSSGVTAVSTPYAGHPDILKARGGKQALNLLRLTLLRK